MHPSRAGFLPLAGLSALHTACGPWLPSLPVLPNLEHQPVLSPYESVTFSTYGLLFPA